MSEFIKLNLSDYFNHKLIGMESEIKSISTLINIGVGGSLFDKESLPNSNEEIVLNNIPFDFPDKSPDNYDNISCEEQLICVPKGEYSSLHILGLCVWGSFKETFILNFNKNILEHAKVFLYDWSSFKFNEFEFHLKVPDCHLVLKAPLSNASSVYCGIYSYQYIIQNANKQLQSIELPYNPNMYIFAITLQKSYQHSPY